jgi:hypothetical protein
MVRNVYYYTFIKESIALQAARSSADEGLKNERNNHDWCTLVLASFCSGSQGEL